MYGPDIPQIEVQNSMARIREAASKTQEAPAKILNKELAKDLPAEFKIQLFSFSFFLDKSLIFSTSFRPILDTFRRNISLDQLYILIKRYIRLVVLILIRPNVVFDEVFFDELSWIPFSNSVRVPNSLDPDQGCQNVGPIKVETVICC